MSKLEFYRRKLDVFERLMRSCVAYRTEFNLRYYDSKITA